MDVKTAFLNGELDEEIYMAVPEGVAAPHNSVCKLNRSLYGLKQSPRMWNRKIDDYLLGAGFTRLNADHGIYSRRTDDSLAILALYVDDLIILANSVDTMISIKLGLQSTFDMSDIGELNHCLGLKVTRDRKQRKLTLCYGFFHNIIVIMFLLLYQYFNKIFLLLFQLRNIIWFNYFINIGIILLHQYYIFLL